MANEITVSATLEYSDAEHTEQTLQVLSAIFSVSTKRITRTKQNIGITEEAINLGDITAPGYALFVNRDTTNFVELRVATGGAKFARLDRDPLGNGKGGVALLRLGSGAQVPFAIADTGTCQVDIFLIST